MFRVENIWCEEQFVYETFYVLHKNGFCTMCSMYAARGVFYWTKKIEFPEKYKRLEQYRQRKRFISTPQQGFFSRNIWENAVLSAFLKTWILKEAFSRTFSPFWNKSCSSADAPFRHRSWQPRLVTAATAERIFPFFSPVLCSKIRRDAGQRRSFFTRVTHKNME